MLLARCSRDRRVGPAKWRGPVCHSASMTGECQDAAARGGQRPIGCALRPSARHGRMRRLPRPRRRMKRFAPLALAAAFSGALLSCAAPSRSTASGRARCDRHGRRDLRREPRLRQSVRPVPGRQRDSRRQRERRRRAQRDRDGSPLAVLPPVWGGLTAKGAAGRDAGADRRPAERRSGSTSRRPQPAARRRPSVYARSRAPLLQNQMQIDGGKNDRFAAWAEAAPSHGLLRRQRDGAVEGRPALHARRQLLHGRVRRLLPQPPVPGLRLRAGLSRRRHSSPAKDSISSVELDAQGRFVRLSPAADAPAVGARRRAALSCATAR